MRVLPLIGNGEENRTNPRSALCTSTLLSSTQRPLARESVRATLLPLLISCCKGRASGLGDLAGGVHYHFNRQNDAALDCDRRRDVIAPARLEKPDRTFKIPMGGRR